MWRKTLTVILLSQLLTVAACTREALNRGAYDAAYQKECLDRTGTMNCDPQHPSYDKYNKQRTEETKPSP
jgi:hypothetical protein